jgi:hypothetical protein
MMNGSYTTTSDYNEAWLLERFERFAEFLEVLSKKDEGLLSWATWVRGTPMSLAISSIRAGALGPDLQRASLCPTTQTRAACCTAALSAKSLEYGFDLANFSQAEIERATRYLELLAHAASPL